MSSGFSGVAAPMVLLQVTFLHVQCTTLRLPPTVVHIRVVSPYAHVWPALTSEAQQQRALCWGQNSNQVGVKLTCTNCYHIGVAQHAALRVSLKQTALTCSDMAQLGCRTPLSSDVRWTDHRNGACAAAASDGADGMVQRPNMQPTVHRMVSVCRLQPDQSMRGAAFECATPKWQQPKFPHFLVAINTFCTSLVWQQASVRVSASGFQI